MNQPLLQIPYRAGWKAVLADLLLVLIMVPLGHLAANNRSELILDGIPISTSGATLLYWAIFLLFGLLVVVVTLGIFYSVLFRPSIWLTESALILPGGVFRSQKSIPYHTITKLGERVVTRRGVPTRHADLVVHASGRRIMIAGGLLSREDYARLKQFLTVRIGGNRNWGVGRVGAPAVTTQSRRKSKITSLMVALIFGGIAVYQLVFAGGLQKQPTVVSIGDFESQVPDNRYVIITGGSLDMRHAVKYQLSHFHGDERPGIFYYVPLLDQAADNPGAPVPKVIVIMSEEEVAKAGGSLPGRIEGVRVPHLPGYELPYNVADILRKSYGSSVDDMVLVDAKYDHKLRFILGVGFAGVAFIALLFFLFGR